jgi:lipid-binding SYLF domain-containing protein
MKTKNILFSLQVLLCLLFVAPAFAGIFGQDETPEEERKQIQAERVEVLKKVSAEYPELQKKVAAAPGYATFSAVNMNLLLLSTSKGTGIVVDNEKNREIYMKVLALAGGIGAGLKDLNILIIFNEYETLEQFVTSGWQFGAQADAALKSGEKGAELGESVSMAAPTEDGVDTSMSSGLSGVTNVEVPMEIYKITEAGISAQATIGGVKFSPDEDLN